MAKPASKAADKPAEKQPLDPQAQMDSFLKQTKEDHFNLEEHAPPLLVSSGSLNLDMEIGGFSEGAHRVGGGPGLGKTPFVLNAVDNFLDAVPDSRAVWCKAEGRFSLKNMARARHPLVYSASEWKAGTILIFKSNVYEAWISMMRSLVTNNPTGCRYAFVTDSLDNMILRNDMAKPIEEGQKIAGAPLLTKQLFQRIGLALNERGHIAFFISQKTSEIKTDQYAKTEQRQMTGSGGNAAGHNAQETLEFLDQWEGDLILKNPAERLHRVTNPAIGHLLKVKVKKSASEKRWITVEIPIKYGVTQGSAIWREREIGDQMLAWGLVTKASSWLTLTPALLGELEKAGITGLPEKVQGLNQLYDLLETRKDVADHLFDTFKKRIGGGAS
jgi:RecA/RadA recombinase